MMWPLMHVVLIYLFGGLTFVPLLIGVLLIHAYFTLPVHDLSAGSAEHDTLTRPGDPPDVIAASSTALEEKWRAQGVHDAEEAAGYFAVCREYVPGGVNGKPPERTTPTGSTAIAAPSPSVYQSMYRSLFDRKPTVNPLDSKGAGKPPRKGGNIFYVVLRHAHLLLFDDAEMLEVRYVLSLAHHDISIYSGGEEIPEGELFIKRNAICLTRKSDGGEGTPESVPAKPFFLFADNTSEKEDFYFAMLKNQERKSDAAHQAVPLAFEVKDIIALVQRLHASEEYVQTRWINAMVGRIFLSLYKTSDIENFIRAKITKKISRVKKPSFLSGIVLRRIDMGEGAPFITNPRLKDLTVDGNCVVEGDVRYTGNFRLEIAATARIDLGARFKAREVKLLLAVVLKKLEGHFYVRIKPPPSNRLWMTFAQPPRIDMSIEPIVSSRQITYTVILRQIENRIKEVIAESIVMPYWDDIAFCSTEGQKWRGGIFADDEAPQLPLDLETAAAEDGEVDEVEHLEAEVASAAASGIEKSTSMPILDTAHSSTTYSRKPARSLFHLPSSKATSSTSSIDLGTSSQSEKPKAIRHGSFTSASSPIVSMDVTNVDAFKPTAPPEQSHAASAMAAISARSLPSSPYELSIESPPRPSSLSKPGSQSSRSSSPSSTGGASLESQSAPSLENLRQPDPGFLPTTIPATPHRTHPPHPGERHSKEAPNPPRRPEDTVSDTPLDVTSHPASASKRTTLTAVANAAASARRWGLNALQRGGDPSKDASVAKPDLTQPMGRGRPIPLPPPDRKTASHPNLPLKRKPLAPPALPRRPPHDSPHGDTSAAWSGSMSEAPTPVSTSRAERVHETDEPAPPLPRRFRQVAATEGGGKLENDADEHGGLFVVAAPSDSEPTTPLESRVMYAPPSTDYTSFFSSAVDNDVNDVEQAVDGQLHRPADAQPADEPITDT